MVGGNDWRQGLTWQFHLLFAERIVFPLRIWPLIITLGVSIKQRTWINQNWLKVKFHVKYQRWIQHWSCVPDTNEWELLWAPWRAKRYSETPQTLRQTKMPNHGPSQFPAFQIQRGYWFHANQIRRPPRSSLEKDKSRNLKLLQLDWEFFFLWTCVLRRLR